MNKTERYLNDAKFHNLVESLEKLVADELFTLQDVSDALDIAAQHSVQRSRCFARGCDCQQFRRLTKRRGWMEYIDKQGEIIVFLRNENKELSELIFDLRGENYALRERVANLEKMITRSA